MSSNGPDEGIVRRIDVALQMESAEEMISKVLVLCSRRFFFYHCHIKARFSTCTLSGWGKKKRERTRKALYF